MAKSLGSNATVEVSPDGVTWTKAFRVKKASFPYSVNPVDSTDNDDGGWKSTLVGDKQVKCSFTVTYDPSDAGQTTLLTNAVAGTKTYLRYRSRGTGSTLPQAYGLVVLEKGYPDSEHEKTQEITFEGMSDGSWTYGTQP